jgi:hypothetical protein
VQLDSRSLDDRKESLVGNGRSTKRDDTMLGDATDSDLVRNCAGYDSRDLCNPFRDANDLDRPRT